MTDVQSQKFAEELPNMHATGLLTALTEYLIVLFEYLDFLQSRW